MLRREHRINRATLVTQDISLARRCFDAALITLLAIASLFVIARIGLKPRDPANGVAVVIPERADYPERMLAGGAVLVLDPQALAACFSGFGLKSASQ